MGAITTQQNNHVEGLNSQQEANQLQVTTGNSLFPMVNIYKKQSMHLTVGYGVLISKDLVLTSAHIFYRQQDKEDKCLKLELYGYPHKYCQYQSFRYLDQFQNMNIRQYGQLDYALIKLNKPVQYNQFLHLQQTCLLCIQSKQFYAKFGHNFISRITNLQACRFGLKYSLSSIYVPSGCPIILNSKIIGIDCGHDKQKKDGYNFGRLITKDLIDNLEKWRKELNGDSFKIIENNDCIHKRMVKLLDAKYLSLQDLLQEINYHNKQQTISTLKNYFEAQQIKSGVYNDEIIKISQSLKKTAIRYQNQTNYDMAIEFYYKSLVIYEQIKGKNTLEAANILNCIGMLQDNKGNYNVALKYYLNALQTKNSMKEKQSTESANILNNIGLVYKNQGNYQKALQYYKLSLEINERVAGKGCFASAIILNNIGSIQDVKLNYHKAIQFYSFSLQIYERSKGKGCIDSANVLNNIGSAYRNLGYYSKALQYFLLSLQIKQRVKGKGCIESATTIENIGLIYKSQGNNIKALEYFTQSYEIKQKVKGTGCIDLTTSLNYIGSVYDSQSNYSKAVGCYSQAISIFQNIGAKYQGYAISQLMLGTAYEKMKQYQPAVQAFKKAFQIFKEIRQEKITNIARLKLKQCLKMRNKFKQILGIDEGQIEEPSQN